MRCHITILITLALFGTTLLVGSAGASGAAQQAVRLDVKVSVIRKQKTSEGYSDDKIQRISYRVDIRNDDRQRAFNSGRATILAFAEDLEDRDESIVIAREEFDVNVDPLTATSLESKQTKLVFDDKGYKYGNKYSGYLLVIKDASGETVSVKASIPSAVKHAEEALKLKFEDICDKSFKFVKKGYVRD